MGVREGKNTNLMIRIGSCSYNQKNCKVQESFGGQICSKALNLIPELIYHTILSISIGNFVLLDDIANVD